MDKEETQKFIEEFNQKIQELSDWVQKQRNHDFLDQEFISLIMLLKPTDAGKSEAHVTVLMPREKVLNESDGLGGYL